MENNSQTSSTIPPNTPNFQIPEYVLDDLCSRFIINIPEEERQDLIRIFFMIELAHWFYLDFYCAENPELKTCGIKDFSAQIFHHCPSLSGHAQEVDKILGNWKSYKMSVPTYGAIMLDPDMKYTLLVQGFWAKASWGFPKGKVNEGEDPCQCAIREVHEETGFDVSSMINKEDLLENKMNEQLTRLYIIKNVPLDTKFQPKTRKEIKSLQWFPVDSLPAHKRDPTSKSQLGLNPNTFFMVIPFVKNLRKWIQNYQNPSAPKPSIHPHSATDSYKSNKTYEDSNNSGKQYRDKQKLKQQQYFAQQNQSEFQEFLQFKDSKTRGREARDQRRQRSESPRKEAYQKGGYSGSQGYSPSFKQDKKQQYQILNRDGNLTGSSRRSLASQFDNQGSPGSGRGGKYSHRQRHTDQSSIDNFIPEAWANFKFDVGAIMACLPSV